MTILETFGFAWGKFFAQIIVVMIVYAVLNRYAFGPVMAMLEARRQRIIELEADRERIKKELAHASEKAGEIITEANRESDRLIAEARESAEALTEKKRQEAVTEAGQIVTKARSAAEADRAQLLTELKRDFGRLVITTTGRVAGKVLTEEDQKRINEETISQVVA